MKYVFWLAAVLLAAPRPFAADPEADRFVLTSCSLGCGGSGANVTCSVVNIHENEELRFGFNDALDPASVNSATFRIFELATGLSPAGSLQIDPVDPRVLVYTPDISFTPLGVPLFGLKSNASYQIQIAGKGAGDPGPYLTSVNGAPLWSRLLCSVTADQGVLDAVPGKPEVRVDVEVVSGAATTTAPAPGATRVALDSDITFRFFDLMNVGTVMAPINGSSISIVVRKAPLVTGEVVPGSFSFWFDAQAKRTTFVFDPDEDFAAGETIYVQMHPLITDLAGNPLQGELFSFVTAGG